jgi:CheY-like chemotaxis protein
MPLIPDKVLVIEDEPANRDAFRRILEYGGFEVVSAEDGRVALAEIGQHNFAAIICDVRMPTLDGPGVYAVIHELFPALAARTIFVTGYGADPRIREFLDGTGQPVLDKPVDLSDLLYAVRQVVAHWQVGGGKPQTE